MGDLNRDMHTGRQTCEDGLRDGVMHSQAKECYRFQQTTSSRERGMDQFLPLSFSLSLPGLQRTSPADSLISDSVSSPSQTLSFQNWDTANFCCLSHPVLGTLLWLPQENNTIPSHPWNLLPPDAFCSSFCKPSVLPWRWVVGGGHGG